LAIAEIYDNDLRDFVTIPSREAHRKLGTLSRSSLRWA
jgi:hypothetical protein